MDIENWALPDYHCHFFKIGKDLYAPESEFDDDFPPKPKPERAFTLNKIVGLGHKEFSYEYDHGDSWLHSITLEEEVALDQNAFSPICIAGARACPPEDCGGTSGYETLLEALKDKKHDRHEELIEWIGEPYDPESFDTNLVNRSLRREKWSKGRASSNVIKLKRR